MNNVEEVDPEDEPRTYRTATTANKLKTILAGVTVNLLIAFILFFIGHRRRRRVQAEHRRRPSVTANSPAAEAGLKTGDKIVAIDGTPIQIVGRPRRERCRPSAGDSRSTVTVERNGRSGSSSPATPEDVGGEGKLGVYPNTVRETYSPLEAVPAVVRV